MSSSVPERSTIRPKQAPRSVRVVNWPLRDGGVRAWGMLAAMGLLAAGAGVVAHSGVMGGFCFAALAIAAWRLWMPVAFEFRSRGVITSVLGRTRQIPWTRIARFEARQAGLVLFAEGDTSQLAALRSLYIRWNGKRDEILEVVEFYSKERVSVDSTRTYLRDATEDGTSASRTDG